MLSPHLARSLFVSGLPVMASTATGGVLARLTLAKSVSSRQWSGRPDGFPLGRAPRRGLQRTGVSTQMEPEGADRDRLTETARNWRRSDESPVRAACALKAPLRERHCA